MAVYPGGWERLPRISHRSFDSTGTVFRMGVALEPDTEYEFMLNHPSGGGFLSTEGIPLAQ